MKRIKIYNYIFIISILFFILTLSVEAETITTTYNNYYFFLKQYAAEKIENSTDYTAFPPISDFGTDKYINAEEICLVRSEDDISECTDKQKADKDNLIWTYDDFYRKLNEIETSQNAYIEEYTIKDSNGEGTSHSSKVLEEYDKKEINKYYTHGSFRNDKSNWQVNTSSSLSDRYDFRNNYIILSCASIRTENNLSHAKVNNNLIITINRTAHSYTIIDTLDINEHISNCSNSNIYRVLDKTDGTKNILSPVLYKYTYTETKEVCDPNLTSPNKGICNSGNNKLSSTCQKQTVTTNNSKADVKINQTGTVANVLTPNSVYQGGGFKLGFVYYNEISWDFAGEILTTLESKTDAKNEIISVMKEKLQKIEVFQGNIELDNIMFGKEYIDSNLIQKKCKRNEEDTFEPGKTITTVCTFYLPNSVVDSYTGKVTYGTSIGTNYGINNKYYTPLNYEGKYNIKATLKNLNILKDDEDWTGDWNLTFDGEKDESCQIDVYGQLYNKEKPKYIYRPIDLKNPFPNRNAGINWYDWYDWYKNPSNKEKLENSYSNLEYSFNLDNETLSSIKSYNNQKDTDGEGYFNWDDVYRDNINKIDKSTFIDNAITDGYGERKGDNS